MLAGHFGQSVPAPVLGTVVPEPGVGLGALILGTFAARRRKRSHLFI
jgi:MYXO-CTERM domain-containing protein